MVNKIDHRSVGYYLRQCLVVAFSLTLLHPMGLIATPGYTESGGINGEPPAAYSLKQPLTANPAERPAVIDYPLVTPLLTQSTYSVLDEDPLGEAEKPLAKKKTIEPVTRKLPIWGEKAREKGFDIPLPFGVGTNLVFMDQGIDVRNLNIDISAPGLDVSGVKFHNSRAHDTAITARLDMWLLPFVNIYGIFGYINGEAELNVNVPAISVDLPNIGNIPITDPTTVNLNIDYNGTTYGGGMTLAGGYKNFFGSLDGNYTYSNIDIANSEIKTYTISPRLGLLVDSSVIPGSLALWVGAMYMHYKQTVTDSIDVNTLFPEFPSVELDFAIDIKNEHPWNFLFGGQWEITKRWQFMAEGGIGDRKQVITGIFFRF